MVMYWKHHSEKLHIANFECRKNTNVLRERSLLLSYGCFGESCFLRSKKRVSIFNTVRNSRSHNTFLHGGGIFYPEDGSYKLLRNGSKFLRVYRLSYPKRQ